MKILFCHNFYQHLGGEDVVVEREVALLKRYGHNVELFSVSSIEHQSFFKRLTVIFNLCHSKKYASLLKQRLVEYRPDIVHIHNTFPILTPSILDVCNELDIPVVCTLHNYRLITPSAILMHDRNLSRHSLNKSAYRRIYLKEYKNSIIASGLIAHLIEYHKKRKTWHHKVNRFICLSEHSKRIFVTAGVKKEKIAVKPNFVPRESGVSDQDLAEAYALFIGRNSEEKGIETLISAWATIDYTLVIVGDGFNSERHNGNKNIQYVGRKTSTELEKYIKNATFVVVPSLCHETFGNTVVEAFSCGVPVLCSDIGAPNEIVNSQNGLHYTANDVEDLSQKARWIIAHPEKIKLMGVQARKDYLALYTAEKNYQMVIDIYTQVIEERNVS